MKYFIKEPKAYFLANIMLFLNVTDSAGDHFYLVCPKSYFIVSVQPKASYIFLPEGVLWSWVCLEKCMEDWKH